jgi:hypothetical protein
MDIMYDALIILGLSSVALLWVFSVAFALHVLWDTFAGHAEDIIERIKK